jgi:hypothetical protein
MSFPIWAEVFVFEFLCEKKMEPNNEYYKVIKDLLNFRLIHKNSKNIVDNSKIFSVNFYFRFYLKYGMEIDLLHPLLKELKFHRNFGDEDEVEIIGANLFKINCFCKCSSFKENINQQNNFPICKISGLFSTTIQFPEYITFGEVLYGYSKVIAKDLNNQIKILDDKMKILKRKHELFINIIESNEKS